MCIFEALFESSCSAFLKPLRSPAYALLEPFFVKLGSLRGFQPQWSGAERRLKTSAAHFLRAVF